ncbi:UDP-N-acetylmuramate--L-alanine ligase [Chryseobacterium geocarposphaerae]|uniref:UDP-N-acetylmuramate--L-alanine ligase n=1 Tax=Chryseobacterium geocarposphaerae TaxID=1416776 RepID=A0A2M9C2F7_9FLAO|nr:UDP-N-acetylmuramate--L-alanine ligase [Chryseobacterium geocarposphaerae]PJJ64611.1 UDP-N-acetylmuramate--L-alanine ligase [Chryseobacterium geocarposphaerae]
MKVLETYQNFYFVGIGGIGMSALARYFHASGKKVLGYDKTNTKLTTALISEGIDIVFEDVIDEKISSLQKEDTLVIYTPAIKVLGILDYFNENQFEVLKRAKVLGLITENTDCIAVAGTHGKTTTSTLVSHLCKEADLPFSCFLGGISENFKSNFLYNGSQYSVVEADEYDRSFLNLSPDWAVITSTDADHLDIYGDKNHIEEGFRQFAALVPNDKQLFVRKGIEIGRPSLTYAVNEVADYYSDNLRMENDKIYFDFHTPAETVKDFIWEIPGIHNVENATVALAILSNLGVDFETLKKAIANFKGIKRRYTKHRYENGKIYIDDYAHHPTEINAVMSSIRTFYPEKKLLVAFQPHLFSRTRDFADGFAESLSHADELILLDIYPARELQENFEGITSSWLLDKATLDKKEVSTLSDAFNKIKEKDFDILLTVGAGNIDTLYDPICEWLSKK